MEKDSSTPAKLAQVYLPRSLPFEEGTGLSEEDPCSRLMFQLLVERIFPEHGLSLEDEEIVFEYEVWEGGF